MLTCLLIALDIDTLHMKIMDSLPVPHKAIIMLAVRKKNRWK